METNTRKPLFIERAPVVRICDGFAHVCQPDGSLGCVMPLPVFRGYMETGRIALCEHDHGRVLPFPPRKPPKV